MPYSISFFYLHSPPPPQNKSIEMCVLPLINGINNSPLTCAFEFLVLLLDGCLQSKEKERESIVCVVCWNSSPWNRFVLLVGSFGQCLFAIALFCDLLLLCIKEASHVVEPSIVNILIVPIILFWKFRVSCLLTGNNPLPGQEKVYSMCVVCVAVCVSNLVIGHLKKWSLWNSHYPTWTKMEQDEPRGGRKNGQVWANCLFQTAPPG